MCDLYEDTAKANFSDWNNYCALATQDVAARVGMRILEIYATAYSMLHSNKTDNTISDR
jgi:hypothetical protein